MALDSDTCRRALNRAHRRLVNDIKPKEVLDLLERDGLLGYEQIKDIRGLLTSSMQNRILLSKISQKGVEGYKIFKECLAESDQKELKKLLDEIEEELYREKNRAETIQEERQRMLKKRELQQACRNAPGSRSASTLEKLDKVPSDRELVSIAPSIGSGWELLAAMLDVKRPAVERIKLDHGYSSVEQIYNMLQHWKQRNANKATFKALLKEMKDCNSVTIDWEELREKLGFGIEALMDPEPMEVEALNPPAPTYALRGGAGGTRAMQPRSLESGVEESEPMDTSLPIAAQNLPGQNVPDAQMANDGQFGAQPQNESRFGDTRAIQPHNEVRLGITTAKMPPNELSSLERLNTEIVIRIKQDLFDGRLISLDQSQIEDIMKLGEAKELAKTKGARVFATSKTISGFNTKVVIKELHIDKDDLDRMRYVTNEKLASRILHFGIVPLLAYHDALLTDQSVRFGYYYFVSPYFEGGNLLKALEEDTNLIFLKQTNSIRMLQKTRLKIIYQVASALYYLHTPVKDFRHDVLHMDIKSLNIVLDLNNNARLIDFGLAREMKEPNAKLLMTASPVDGTVGYFPTTTFQGLTKFHDYHNFGVVIRELLTGINPAQRFQTFTLRTMSSFRLKDNIQKEIWKKEKVWKALLDLAEKCVGSLGQHTLSNTFQISEMLLELEPLMREVGAQRWSRNPGKECEVCLVNQAAEESEFLKHDDTCMLHINVCASCMRNSFLNPIICHTCETEVQPFIGRNWGAILIAGNDKDKLVADAFKNDVHRLKEVITSRSVPIMCIREESIEVVTPDEPDMEDNKLWGKVQDAFKKLKEKSLKTLLVVYSGHHGFQTKEGIAKNEKKSIGPLESVTGSTIAAMEGYFQLSENELMKDVELCNEIQQLKSVDKIFLFEDCCHGDVEIKTALTGKTVVKFNSSNTTTPSSVDFKKKESKYIGTLIKALTATVETKHELYQHKDCKRCEDIANTLFYGNFLTVNTLHSFLTEYIEHCKNTEMKSLGSPILSLQNLSGKDCILAYRYSFQVAFQFEIKKPKGGEVTSESICLNKFDDCQRLKENLFRKMLSYDESTKYLVENEDQLKVYAAAVSIQVKHGPSEVHLKEIDSLEQASSAWIARRELIAQIRSVEKIDLKNYDVAGIFVLPTDVQDIFKIVNSLRPKVCLSDPMSERLVVDRTDLPRCVTELEELRRKVPERERFKHVFFDFNHSLDHIDAVLRNKHEDVSNVKVHIIFPKNKSVDVSKFWPFIFYRIERASAQS
ncbi:uncharacterized protein LOC128231463 isoform X2 [Mya arenaria]|uniref:uncharacterized protein LOC128231463 isoform X2 n=1 Tax=Mya arenaria TaxID=6604 RepID=UPI0022E7EEA8|nr:uncharacterized protein LOC128231463 isoform X2 [Mya arenaria]